MRLKYALDLLAVPAAIFFILILMMTFIPGAPLNDYDERQHIYPDSNGNFTCPECLHIVNVSIEAGAILSDKWVYSCDWKLQQAGEIEWVACPACGYELGWARIWTIPLPLPDEKGGGPFALSAAIM